MREEQFIQLPAQGNIYSISKLGNHLIVGTGEYGKVFAQTSKTEVREVPLQNLPRKLYIYLSSQEIKKREREAEFYSLLIFMF